MKSAKRCTNNKNYLVNVLQVLRKVASFEISHFGIINILCNSEIRKNIFFQWRFEQSQFIFNPFTYKLAILCNFKFNSFKCVISDKDARSARNSGSYILDSISVVSYFISFLRNMGISVMINNLYQTLIICFEFLTKNLCQKLLSDLFTL